MFDSIIAYSIKHKAVVGLLVLGLIAVGSYSLKHLPIDALPDITNNQVQIITTSPNLATEEVELFITYPIELAVKSIPDITELRSISRSGLSLVTVVFDEDVDIYWARNQISERLREAEQEIPETFGRPELAPISTGLSEIYQYTISADSSHAELLDIMQLRSIQDWIIVPQLIGTPGVAEVNTLGGLLKEYEVAVNPDRLKSMGVTMVDIFEALRNNNENTGGAYIDKQPYSYFIRSIGMVNSLDDISKIVVTVKNNIPLLIRDVAEVQYGSPVRYGATTANGTGEVVNGMVMMLKGENSAEVVELVKTRMDQIIETLPEGVIITPYLDRSNLVNRAVTTVQTNLIEGALIVIFILVLLIGNWRAGLIVASVIPLALLFAVSLMRFFGVSGNLMSLGAIDFGLIVDGAVIIVEAIVHRLHSRKDQNKLASADMDQQVYQAASGIRKTAAFGEIIILIVYLPILALQGIEGKMFTPMAQTVAFAILGAFILSLTYVPMMSALLLNRKVTNKKGISDRIMDFFKRLYEPVLHWAFRFRLIVLAMALVGFIASIFLFNSLGGEFIPTLSEGDIATHVMIPPGSSLSQEIATTTRAEQLLLANFPEIKQVVSKIGSAEVPTDPMPIEVADVMIIMKDQSEWTSASTKQEMFDKMEAVLDDLPGVTTEFSQPIQMRFNELMTGIRSDVGIKIFGDNVDALVAIGDRVVNMVSTIEGVQDTRAEAVSGLPQINIEYNKDKLALYGLSVRDLNQVVSMGFAGAEAGSVYEAEKKYGLVVRLAEPYRRDISNIENLYVSLPSGNQIPLGQVADIKLIQAPAQISRDNGKRRMIVGLNVRGRDTETVVQEIQDIIKTKLDLPVGYYVEYAGQFENLKRAKSRLAVAVPIALALIFVLLFFTFQSIKQSILIFTAIPLSAIGGVLALWMRGMPFSISAGIGFIALFGVAVLNGIVLIGYFNKLKEEGITDIFQRIKLGTSVRLRPVIMTASVASLGFLPMALSTSAGAEVQKPLATVVIGGLLTATLLTLVVLPILYYYVEKYDMKIKKTPTTAILLICAMSIGSTLSAQSTRLETLDEAISLAFANNGNITASKLNIEKYEQLSDGAYLMPKAEISASIGQMNTRLLDQSYEISQRFNPFLSKVKKAMAKEQVIEAQIDLKIKEQDVRFKIRALWDHIQYVQSNIVAHQSHREYLRKHNNAINRRYELGESTYLDKSMAQTELNMLERSLLKLENEHSLDLLKLQSMLNISDSIWIDQVTYEPNDWSLNPLTTDASASPLLQKLRQEIIVAQHAANTADAAKKPDFTVGYFIQSIRGEQTIDNVMYDYNSVPRFQGVQLGIGIPIFGKGYKAMSQAAASDQLILIEQERQLTTEIENEVIAVVQQYIFDQDQIHYYQKELLPELNEILSKSQRSYELGDIGLDEYYHVQEYNFDMQLEYLKAINQYNQTVNTLRYLTSQ